MKPFNLEAAMRGEPIITKDGHQAKYIGRIDAPVTYPVVIYVQGDLIVYGLDGKVLLNADHPKDLFMKSEKQWVNLYAVARADKLQTYPTESQAEAGRMCTRDASDRGMRFVRAEEVEV